jgi:restriction system protein
MALPAYQTLMLPVLTMLADGSERSFSQLLPPLAEQCHLTDEDRARLLPSGRQQMFHDGLASEVLARVRK